MATAYAVTLTPPRHYAEVGQVLTAYRAGTATRALAEIRRVAKACPHYTNRARDGRTLRIDVVVSAVSPPLGAERVVIEQRSTSTSGALYYTTIVFRDGDVLCNVTSVAADPLVGGKLAGQASAIAARRLNTGAGRRGDAPRSVGGGG